MNDLPDHETAALFCSTMPEAPRLPACDCLRDAESCDQTGGNGNTKLSAASIKATGQFSQNIDSHASVRHETEYPSPSFWPMDDFMNIGKGIDADGKQNYFKIKLIII
jgi:hypothetical protein